MINNFSRPLTNDKSRNKDKYINNKLKQLKTFNKNHAKLFGNGIIEDESINSDNASISVPDVENCNPPVPVAKFFNISKGFEN